MPRLFGRVTDPPQDALPFTPGCSIPYSAVWTASVVLDVEFEESGLWAEVEQDEVDNQDGSGDQEASEADVAVRSQVWSRTHSPPSTFKGQK